MDPQIRDLARRSQNFGFLAAHEPFLVVDGASAESHVYADPDSAMFKARRFAETLAKLLVVSTQVKVSGDTQHARIQALARSGVLAPHIREKFDDIRTAGNQAVHSHYGDVRAALTAVQRCFELGLWLHRARTGDREPRAFVPPDDPDTGPERLSVPAQAEFDQLREELDGYRARLREVLLHRDTASTELQAQQRARSAAEQALARATSDRDELRAMVAQLETRAAELKAAFDTQVAKAPRVSAARREAFIDSAQRAAQEPLTEAEVRVEVDRMLAAAGWLVQDVDDANLFAGPGVALREVRTSSGPADYLLYVDRALVGVIEAKREGQALSAVEAQSGRYARSLTKRQRAQAWREPLPFRYETTATETQFTNGLDPRPRAREVFCFHRPETLARWMREAGERPEAPTLRARLRRLPALDERGLRPAQIEAIRGLEQSLARDDARALIQMATGAGKTYTVVAESYRLLKYAGANRILFLVDRNNLGAVL